MGLNAPLTVTIFVLLAARAGLPTLGAGLSAIEKNFIPPHAGIDSVQFTGRLTESDGRLNDSAAKILNSSTSDIFVSRGETMHNIRRRQVGPQSQFAAAAGFSALRCRLYCQNGFYLQSHLDGSINGTRESGNKFAILEMLRVAVKLVSIRGLTGGNYICMNRKGKMYGSRRRNAECVFLEEYLETKTFVYSSRKFSRKRRQLYIGINRKGRGRRGKRRKQRSVQFYILPVESESDYFNAANLEPNLDLSPTEDGPSVVGENEPPDTAPDTVETQEVD